MAASRPSSLVRRLLSGLMVPALVLTLLLALPQTSQAASGGRIGGGSFRSAPCPAAMGVATEAVTGAVAISAAMAAAGFPCRPSWWRRPLWLLDPDGRGRPARTWSAAVAVRLFRRACRAVRRPRRAMVRLVAQLQVGLLASARAAAGSARPRRPGRHQQRSQRVLQDSTLALLRQPDLWVYQC